MENTTIQISHALKEKLEERKLFARESYEEIISDLLEDTLELSEETKRDIKEAEEDIRKGRIHRWEDIKKELKINVRDHSF